MRYRVSGDGWEKSYSAKRDPFGREWRIAGEGEDERTLLVRAIEGHRVLRITLEGTTHTLTILPGNRPREPLRFLLDDAHVELSVKDEIDLLTEVIGDPGKTEGEEPVESVMPGIIRRVLVCEGDDVELDQPLFILEAMKMENEVRAPAAGRVLRVAVSESAAVAVGELLAVIGMET